MQNLNLAGLRAAEVGSGSGILALSAAKAGAATVLALDINPAAVLATTNNARANMLETTVEARLSNLFSSVPPEQKFDIVIASPPSFAGEPRSMADRAWHAGANDRDIAPLFQQAKQRIMPGGKMYLLLSSDSDLMLFDKLIEHAGFAAKEVARRSILVESFIIFELTSAKSGSVASLCHPQSQTT